MNPDYKLIRTFESVAELKIAKSYLESHGIDCFVPDENMSSLYGNTSSLFRGGRLFVKKKDFARAIKLLNTLNQLSS